MESACLQSQAGFGAQGLPLGVQGLGNDLAANRFQGGLVQPNYGNQGLNNTLAGFNAGLAGRRFPGQVHMQAKLVDIRLMG